MVTSLYGVLLVPRERCTFEIEHFVLPYIIAYTCRLHSFVLPFREFYHFSSTSRESCTSETKHFVHSHIIAYTSNHYYVYFLLLFILPLITVCTSHCRHVSISTSIHVFTTLIFFYILLDYFIIFSSTSWSLHFQKLDTCTSRRRSCVLPRVIVCTSSLLGTIYYLHFPKSIVLLVVDVCTSCRHHCTSCIFFEWFYYFTSTSWETLHFWN
jgi:hypothetical protein